MSTLVLHSIERSSAGLIALTSNADGRDGLPCFVRMPLAGLPASAYPARDALLADWELLRKACTLDEAWPAFWRVFWQTVSDAESRAAVPVPRRVAPPGPPAATAAHPRAFRGTKYRPPKPAQPDLLFTAWLADDRLLDAFFARHDFVRLPGLQANGSPLQAGPAPTAASLWGHWPVLPPPFRRIFAWRLRTCAVADVHGWLHVWRELDEPEYGPLLARLCAQDPAAHSWAALALHLPLVRRRSYLMAIGGVNIAQLPAEGLNALHLGELDSLTDDLPRFEACLQALLSNLSRGVSARYTLQGCALARTHDPLRLVRALSTDRDCANVPMDDIERLCSAVATYRPHWKLSAWELCGVFPGFDQVVRHTPWERLDEHTADQWLALFAGIRWDEYEEDRIRRRWIAFRAVLPGWLRALNDTPAAGREKFVRMLRDYVSGWQDPVTLRDSALALLPLHERLCRPPFSYAADGDCILSSLAENLQPAHWRALAAAQDTWWLMVERACRRGDDTTLTQRGLHMLAKCWPEFTMQALFEVPKRLLRSARLLGCMAYDRRRQFPAEAARDPWFSSAWTELVPMDACRLVRRLCAASGIDSPLPRRLREHLDGATALSEAQLARHCRVTLARLMLTRLAALEQLIWQAIDQPFALREHSAAARHALRLHAGLSDNRNGLRRFLREYSAGQPHAYLAHPLNQAWFDRHPRIDPQRWNTMPLHGHVENMPGVEIALETDPLEILMLGTYVGSCLGIGGACDYSAVACLLDANKKVIYARDARGRVLARQLLAIDEEDRLVCFAVYPDTASAALREGFQRFGLELAHRLRLDIFPAAAQSGYRIAHTLAASWWDDGLPHQDA